MAPNCLHVGLINTSKKGKSKDPVSHGKCPTASPHPTTTALRKKRTPKMALYQGIASSSQRKEISSDPGVHTLVTYYEILIKFQIKINNFRVKSNKTKVRSDKSQGKTTKSQIMSNKSQVKSQVKSNKSKYQCRIKKP